MSENTAKIQRGKPFEKGQSGNPTGKPRGARNKTTLALQELLDGEAEAITRRAIELAKDGDITAIRLVMERILPARKDNPVTFAIPEINKLDDIVLAVSAIIQAVADGEITPSEGQAITAMIEHLRCNIETLQLQKKLEHLESLMKSRE